MERLLMDDLVIWKNKKRRKPLIIHGARQVGKTWIMKEFGSRYFEQTIYISFDNNERMKNVFDMDYDIGRIISAIKRLFWHRCGSITSTFPYADREKPPLRILRFGNGIFRSEQYRMTM